MVFRLDKEKLHPFFFLVAEVFILQKCSQIWSRHSPWEGWEWIQLHFLTYSATAVHSSRIGLLVTLSWLSLQVLQSYRSHLRDYRLQLKVIRFIVFPWILFPNLGYVLSWPAIPPDTWKTVGYCVSCSRNTGSELILRTGPADTESHLWTEDHFVYTGNACTLNTPNAWRLSR